MNIEKDVEKKTYRFRICNICGCKQYSTNFARHARTKKHTEADYADQKFEVMKYELPPKKNTEFLRLT